MTESEAFQTGEPNTDNLNIPQSATKTEQVAAVLTQRPALYDHPQKVMDAVDCSRTTFYEGRKLFDADSENGAPGTGSATVDTSDREIPESGERQSITVNGVEMVPITELEEARERIRELEQQMGERIKAYQ